MKETDFKKNYYRRNSASGRLLNKTNSMPLFNKGIEGLIKRFPDLVKNWKTKK